MIKLNTPTLFFLLVKSIEPDLICDVGSYDGQISLILRNMAPDSVIVAFEAHPRCHQLMVNDQSLDEANIDIIHGAVSNSEGQVTFYISPDNTESKPATTSSLQGSRMPDIEAVGVDLPSIRLDSFIQQLDPLPGSVALWIDVEGAAYDVLDGTRGIRESVKIIHVEVETKQIWPDQKTQAEVVDMLASLGYSPLARGRDEIQHDIVFIDNRLRERLKFKITFLLLIAFILTYLRDIIGRRLFSWISRFFRILADRGYV